LIIVLGLGAGKPQLYPRFLRPVHSGICEGVAFGVVEIVNIVVCRSSGDNRSPFRG